MKSNHWLLLTGLMVHLTVYAGFAQETPHGTVITEHLASTILKANRTGLDPNRIVKVYLPPSYDTSGHTYPVIYYFHSINWSAEQLFEDSKLVQVLERSFANGTVPEFILVAADYSSPTMGSWYENSSTTGNWLGFTVEELIPFVDTHFRTIRHRDSRGLAGDFLGGYGALKFAMLYPDLFSVVYALHPVGTGSGQIPMQMMADWRRIHQATSFDALWGDHYAPGFVAMAQAYLPNPNRPPFYCDFIVEMVDGEPTVNAENLIKLQSRFLLDEFLKDYGDNLRKMRGIAFDWARYDRTLAHVYSNQAFSRKLDELGIEHIGEEYNGEVGGKNWIEHGRVEDDMLPFFAQHLVFGEHTSSE